MTPNPGSHRNTRVDDTDKPTMSWPRDLASPRPRAPLPAGACEQAEATEPEHGAVDHVPQRRDHHEFVEESDAQPARVERELEQLEPESPQHARHDSALTERRGERDPEADSIAYMK